MMKTVVGVGSALVILSLALGIAPADPVGAGPRSESVPAVELLSQFGGLPTGMEARGNYLFVGVGRRLLVMAIDHPDAPRIISQSDLLPAPIKALRLGGDNVVVELRGRGIGIIDVTDVGHPRFLGILETIPGYTSGFPFYDLRVENNYAYGYFSSELNVIDLWDKNHPRFYGRYRNIREQYISLAVSGRYAYLGTSSGNNLTSGLRIVDVRSPAEPSEMAFLPLQQEIRKIAVQGRYAYLYGYALHSSDVSTFYVIDIGDPSHPLVAGQVTLSTNYIESLSSEMTVHKDHVFLLTGRDMAIIDIRSSATPRVVHNFDMALGGRYGTLAGDWLFVTDGYYNRPLKVIDIEDPSLPTLRWTYHLSGVGKAVDIGGYRDRIYTISEVWDPILAYPHWWLRAFDVADPQVSHLMDELELPRSLRMLTGIEVELPWQSRDVVVTELGRVFVPSELGLLAIDTTDATQLRIAGAISTYGTLDSLVVQEPCGFVADGPAGLTVLDLTDPQRMDIVASLPLPYEAEDLAIVGDNAFVVSVRRCPDRRECRIERLVTAVDVSNPRRPKIVDQLPIDDLPGGATRGQVITAVGEYLYVQDRYRHVIDVQDPRHIHVVSRQDTPYSSSASVAIQRPFMFATGSQGEIDFFTSFITMYDISDAARPLAVQRIDTDGPSVDVWVRDRLLAVADGDHGLALLRLTTPTPAGAPTATPTAPITPPPDATATPTLGIRVLPATPEFTPYPFPTPRPATPTPSLRQQIFMPLAQRAATG
jgi:hypothetical protein